MQEQYVKNGLKIAVILNEYIFLIINWKFKKFKNNF